MKAPVPLPLRNLLLATPRRVLAVLSVAGVVLAGTWTAGGMMAEAGSQPAMPRVECRVAPGKGADMGAETFCAALSAEIAARLAPGAAALIRAEIAQPNPRMLRVRLSWFATPEGGGTALGESPEMGLDVMDRDRLPDAQIRRLARDLVTRSGLSLRD